MNGFGAFLAKELQHVLRSYRLLIIAGIFLVLGFMNAPITKFTPQILEMAGVGDMSQAMGLADPTALDAWAQFFANVAQMGVLVLLLICGNTLSGERSHGTLVLPLTRGLGRTGIIVVKFLVSSALWSIGLLVATLVSLVCTVVLFPGEGAEHLVLAVAALWLLGEFLLALVPLSSVLFKGSFSGLILPGAALFVTLVLSAFPELFFFNPLLLGSEGLAVMAGAQEPLELLAPTLTAAILALASLITSTIVFRKSSV
jgi:ABC-2 type transport system permease protein